MIRIRFSGVWILAAALWLAATPGWAGRLGSLRVFIQGGERYVSTKELADLYGMSFRVPPGRRVYLQNKWNAIEFEVDSRSARVNGIVVWLHAPVLKLRGRWVVAEADVYKVIDPLMNPSAYLGPRGTKVVVLDPGHGGDDRGARGRRGAEEKRAVLDIARRARLHLVNAGLKVYLTRETDRFVELEERCAKAGRWGADLFVSIHLNSAPSSMPRGLETYVLALAGYPSTAADADQRPGRVVFPGNRFDSANTVLGYSLQRALLEKAKGLDRGLRRARFVVVKNAPCPAALLECGFLSNSGEEGRLLTDAHRETVALAISKGILDYVTQVRRAQAAAP
jgi:N-acetylmuramoyl-L-alanine amidase